MSTVTVWKFDTPYGADEALSKLERLHSELLVDLHDAAVVSWELTSDAVFDKVAAEFRDTSAELIKTNLSDEDEARLREAFAED